MARWTYNKEESNPTPWIVLAILAMATTFFCCVVLDDKNEQLRKVTAERDALLHQSSFELSNPEGNPDEEWPLYDE